MKITQICLLIFLTLFSFNVASYQDKGQEAFQRGHFELALEYWDKALSNISPEKAPEHYLDTSIKLSMAYQSLGRLKEALRVLQAVKPFAKTINKPIRYATFLSHLSDIYIAMIDLKDSDINDINHHQITTQEEIIKIVWNLLEEAEAIVRKQNNNNLLANILNKKGNMLSLQTNILSGQGDEFEAEAKYFNAIEIYKNSVELANKVGDYLLSAKISINIIQTQIDDHEILEKELKSKTIFQQVQELPNSHDKAFSLIRLAHVIQNLKKSHKSEVRTYAYHALIQALNVSQNLKDNHAITYAKRDLAKLYADDKRYDEAIQLTRSAIFHTQNAFDLPTELQQELWGSPDLLFRWEWQLATFLKLQGKHQKAINAYERATKHLNAARQNYRCAPQSFCKTAEKFHFEFADLLLQQAATKTVYDDEKQELLRKTINNIESLKRSELQNYSQDLCLIDKNIIDVIDDENQFSLFSSNVAIYYPILFDDRIEILLNSKMGIQQFVVSNIDAKKLIQQGIRKFLHDMEGINSLLIYSSHSKISTMLEKRFNYLFQSLLPNLQKLHSFLIEPIISVLKNQRIDTLVIVPHGILHNFPFSALYDGKQFFIERYAIAVIPGLKLINPVSLKRDKIKMLLAGVSEGINKYPPLPYVADELKNIHSFFGGDLLLNKDFTRSNLETKLTNNSYSIVHFATHARFTPNGNFLLTYDKKLNITDLEALINDNGRFREQPLELVVFSASETARGNEHTVLGLAGVVVKAGAARSAVGNLWPVSDQIMAYFMKKFYRQLKMNPYLSKAKVLQQAQLRLLKSEKYKHPYFWAPFILVGSWL